MTTYKHKKTNQDISESDLEREFNNFLDETYDEVSIAGYTHIPTSIYLKSTNPAAYWVAFSNWALVEHERSAH